MKNEQQTHQVLLSLLKTNHNKKINLGLATMITALALGTAGILTFGIQSTIQGKQASQYLNEHNTQDSTYQALDKSSRKNLGLMFGTAGATITALFGGYYFFCEADKDRKLVKQLETENNEEAE